MDSNLERNFAKSYESQAVGAARCGADTLVRRLWLRRL